jgi:hypothetical protein
MNPPDLSRRKVALNLDITRQDLLQTGSQHWRHIFQPLEKPGYKVPRLGKTAAYVLEQFIIAR